MNNLRSLLGIKRMDRVLNALKREMCGVMKGVGERIDDGVFWWFTHVERTENNRIAESLCRRVCW